jgi:hypothetical protein
MILKSEGEKIRHLTGPPVRERKYGIIAYTQVLIEAVQQIPDEPLTIVVKALIDLCA